MTPLDLQGRHYQDAVRPPMLWKCPACGAEQTGRPEAGCPSCGAGQPGKHVGVDPIVRPGDAPGKIGNIGELFIAWFRPLRGKYDAPTEEILFHAFTAGYELGMMHSPSQTPLPGTSQSRTIVAALKLFVDEVLTHAHEEIASGEYLSIQDTRNLIAKLERTQ